MLVKNFHSQLNKITYTDDHFTIYVVLIIKQPSVNLTFSGNEWQRKNNLQSILPVLLYPFINLIYSQKQTPVLLPLSILWSFMLKHEMSENTCYLTCIYGHWQVSMTCFILWSIVKFHCVIVPQPVHNIFNSSKAKDSWYLMTGDIYFA